MDNWIIKISKNIRILSATEIKGNLGNFLTLVQGL